MPEITEQQLTEFQNAMKENGELKTAIAGFETKITGFESQISQLTGDNTKLTAANDQLKQQNSQLSGGLKKQIALTDINAHLVQAKDRTGRTVHPSIIGQFEESITALDISKRGTEEWNNAINKICHDAYEMQGQMIADITGDTSGVNEVLDAANAPFQNNFGMQSAQYPSTQNGASIPATVPNYESEQAALMANIGMANLSIPTPAPMQPNMSNQNNMQTGNHNPHNVPSNAPAQVSGFIGNPMQ